LGSRLHDLLAIMERLRGADGCPWDRAQTFASIAPYTIEESYEVADAVERGDMADLKDELGDLLFQVVFQARIAQEAGHFDFDGVVAAICDKLVRRHPFVFGEASADAPAGPVTAALQSAVWEDIKAHERAAAAAAAPTTGAPAATGAAPSALDGVPLALPALLRAVKLSKRAARVGFDFERAEETADKVAEELAEVREAVAAAATAARATTAAAATSATTTTATATAAADAPTAAPKVFEEVGDLLFAAANLARKLDVDAEAALRAANLKFQRRFQGMERLAAQRGAVFETLSLAEQEALWQEIKRAD
jgi:MazG family protein